MGGSAVVGALIGRPVELPGDVVARFPELLTVRWRYGGVPVRIAGLFMAQGSIAAITLWRTVFLAPRARLDPQLLLHELRHVHHFEAHPAFPLMYVWESLVRGYKRNRFEVDARAYAAQRLASESKTFA